MLDVGNLAEWVGGVGTVISVIVAIVVFKRTVNDGREQNRLNWKPHLAFDHSAPKNNAAEFWQIGATNIGKGPALECRYIGYVRGTFYRARAFAIGAEQKLQNQRSAMRLYEREAGDPKDEKAVAFCHRALDDLIGVDTDRVEVLLCSDVFGTRWRFVRGRPYPDGPRPADESAPNGWWSKWQWKADGKWVDRARDEDSRRLLQASGNAN